MLILEVFRLPVELGLNFMMESGTRPSLRWSKRKVRGKGANFFGLTFAFYLNPRWLNKLGIAVIHHESTTKDEGIFHFKVLKKEPEN